MKNKYISSDAVLDVLAEVHDTAEGDAQDAIHHIWERVKELPDADVECSRWISVKERLPEPGVMVLTAIRGSDVIYSFDGETLEDAINRTRQTVRVSTGFIGSDGWYGADCFPSIVTPCAWMPLPEPPKEGERWLNT